MKFAGELKTRDGRTFEVENVDADEYRLKQMIGQWLPAGQVCCYLGIANPLGFGSAAEVTEVRLSQVPHLEGRAVYVPTDDDVAKHDEFVRSGRSYY